MNNYKLTKEMLKESAKLISSANYFFSLKRTRIFKDNNDFIVLKNVYKPN